MKRTRRVAAGIAALGIAVIAAAQSGHFAGRTHADWTRINPVTPLTVATFKNPPANDRPWVRLNMPPTADLAELGKEMHELHDAGIAGVEVGQGAFPNNEQLIAILTAANEVGLKVSLSHGPTQNPAGYSIDSDHARKSLFLGKASVSAGAAFDGALPAPTLTQGSVGGFGGRGARPGGPGGPGGAGGPGGGFGPRGPQAARATLVAVLAFRCAATPCPATGPIALDRASLVDLTSSVTGRNTAGYEGGTTAGNLRWAAPASPAGAQWQVIAFWARGVFAQPDPFSEAGYAELIRSMETGLSPQVQELLKKNRGDLFYDSHSSDRGSPDELWTSGLDKDFARRLGYPLIPNLPALFREIFDFTDGTAPRVREDFYALRGDLWLTRQIDPLRKWVRGWNNVLRVQVEGEANLTIPITDMVTAAAAVDRPEHENLFVGDEVDNYLPIASANHMTGNPWYSTECCPALGRAYSQTFQDTVIRMHRSYVGGITKLIYHVYPYRDGATWKWPGYHNFGPAGFSNAWGPRQPYWADARLYNDYFSRIQQALTQGDARTDVAVYMQNYLYPPSQGFKYRHWGDTKLQEEGYTRDYLNTAMLELPNAAVTNKRLAVNGPGYRALIIDSEQGPPTDPAKTAMPVETARKILGFARVGLPVIVVGRPPQRVPGNSPNSDAALRAVIADLLAQPSVAQVAHEADVPAKLRALGIRPAADPGTPSSVLNIRRRDEATRTDYYFFYNQGIVSPPDEPMTLFEPATGEPVEREVSLEGSGQPYLLNAWSGAITPVAEYTSRSGRISLRVRLSRDNGLLLAVSDAPNRFGARTPVTRRAPQPGAPLDLTRHAWKLVAEDWQPVNPYTTTFGVKATETRKETVEVDLNGLQPWPKIPQLQHAAGMGTYTVSFDRPEGWARVRLSLGEVFDSFTVQVNGKPVPIDQIGAEAQIGEYLKPGRNTIVVRVATTLNNRLAQLDPDVAARGLIQPYGLVGPVVLTPE